jgi:phosphoglycerate dehydrogenase-like enzyme
LTQIALEPNSLPEFKNAIESQGAQIAPLAPNVRGLVWTDYSRPDLLAATLAENPQLTWVQLPFAGVDAFANILGTNVTFTSAKGAYREPVAEHALALCLALGRAIPTRVRAKTWGAKFAVSLYESRVLIVGAGGITEELLRLLQPFGCHVTVVRRENHEVVGATETVTFDHLDEELPEADFVVVAAALTDETRALFDERRLSLMKRSAFLVNVARGGHIVTDDLLAALQGSVIAGAAIDVTDPEPLPDGHPLWNEPNCLITPHTADTPEQVNRLLAERIRENVAAFTGNGTWVGLVDPNKGY